MQYVGERVAHMFRIQKRVIREYLKNNASGLCEHMEEKHWKDVEEAYDAVCLHNLRKFKKLCQDMLTATFAKPGAFLTGMILGRHCPNCKFSWQEGDPGTPEDGKCPESGCNGQQLQDGMLRQGDADDEEKVLQIDV